MKVLLIQPPVQDFYDTDVRLQPIGLCYLKAAVRKHLPDVEVIVRDAHGAAGRRTVTAGIPGGAALCAGLRAPGSVRRVRASRGVRDDAAAREGRLGVAGGGGIGSVAV